MSEKVATHDPPSGGADFLIRVDLAEHGMPGRAEQLWARQVADQRFVVCSTPFFAYGIAVADEVATTPDFVVTDVVKRSGRRVLRVAVTPEYAAALQDPIHELLARLQLEHEWHRLEYVAVDLPDATIPHDLLALLDDRRGRGDLHYELA